ncbi:hypothetical protein niasHT_006260 [Heterodera trifolii]|uniref:Uncharacterized protein n=1 Tax=Heterodera trifolii TaxID=157864 RepID=A0ABD2MCR8_9BILA
MHRRYQYAEFQLENTDTESMPNNLGGKHGGLPQFGPHSSALTVRPSRFGPHGSAPACFSTVLQHLRPYICAPNICAPTFAPLLLRPYICAPTFAPLHLRLYFCTSNICAPYICAPIKN